MGGGGGITAIFMCGVHPTHPTQRFWCSGGETRHGPGKSGGVNSRRDQDTAREQMIKTSSAWGVGVGVGVRKDKNVHQKCFRLPEGRSRSPFCSGVGHA